MKKLLLVAALICSSSAYSSETFSPFRLQWKNSSPAGAFYSSIDHRHGIFVIHAFYTGCEWNHLLEPEVIELANYYQESERVQVLDVGIDRDDRKYASWIEAHNPPYPVLKDATRQLLGQVYIEGYPTTFVLDCHGNIHLTVLGAVANWRTQVQSVVDELLHEECDVVGP